MKSTIGVPLFVSLIAAFVLCESNASAAPLVLLQDNFNDNAIDPSKWNVVTSGIPQGNASVTETGGHIELRNRGMLNTAQQFKPDDPAVGGLRISGQWTFTISLDYMEIHTRSDGTPSGTAGEVANGVEFTVNNEDPHAQILLRNGQPTEVLAVSATTLANTATGTFNFVATDDGNNLSFLVQEVGNPSNSVSVSTTFANVFASNLITFHNREFRTFQSNVAFLDNVKIESLTLPEPSSAALALIALTIGAVRRQRLR